MPIDPSRLSEVGPQGGYAGRLARVGGRAKHHYGRAPNLVKAVMIMAGSSLLFNMMNAIIRHVSADLHVFEIAFFRNVFGILALSPFFIRQGIKPLRTKQFGKHLIRAAINVVSMMCFFYAIAITPLAEVASLGFTLPLFVTIYAALFMGERLRARRIGALVVGAVGAAIIVRPWMGTIDLGAMLVLAGSAIWGAALLLTKVMAREDSSVTITSWAAILLAALAFIPALTVWEWPTMTHLMWFAAMGVLGTLGALGIVESLKLAEANAIMPFDFIKLLWASLLGFIIFGEVPDVWVWVGGAVILASTVYLTYRESKVHKEATVENEQDGMS
jgi:drug/metabolite transporter (DMT)-like permease